MRPSLVIACVLAPFAGALPAQVITTVAGTNWIFLPTPLQALKAPLGGVTGVAVDAKGNVYVADPDNNMILRIAASGTLTVVAGNGIAGLSGDGGPATSASLARPGGVALDPTGNFYISDAGRIRRVSPSGMIATVAGGGTLAPAQADGGPATLAALSNSGVAVDSTGNLYISEYNTNRIRKVTPAGVITTIAGNGVQGFSGDGGPAILAELGAPTGVAVDPAGNVYIADNLNKRVRMVAPNGIITTIAGGGTDYTDEGIAATLAYIPQPSGLALDSAGNLYVSEYFQRARRISPKGIIHSVAGGQTGFAGDGGPALSASMLLPRGIALDSNGNLFIADSGNGRVRQVNVGGIINTVAGNGGYRATPDGTLATSAWLEGPEAVAMDAAGNLVVADTQLLSIRKITPAGLFYTTAGAPLGTPFKGTPFTYYFNDPDELAFDPSGNLYVGSISPLARISPNGTL